MLSQVERERYEQKMEEAYPELALCQDHWKAHAIATQTYPGWMQTQKEKTARHRVKVEDMPLKHGPDDIDALVEDGRSKRPRSEPEPAPSVVDKDA